MKRYYGQMLLSLSESWNVRAFWFDWRKDLKLAAAELEAQIRGWFDDNVPVHILAHSMGGLVARTFIKNYPERWKTMWDEKGKGGAGGRLIMFGTPNHGSFASPQVITGLEGMVKKLALADLRHSQRELLTIINSFVGTYQMLPSPFLMKSMEPLYKSETYGDLNVLQHHLDNARNHHKLLEDVVDAERMIYIAGYNQPTFSNILDWKKLDKIDGYDVTMKGDGRVPHELGLLKTPGGKEIKTFYIEEQHADLVLNDKVLASLDELLETGSTKGLSDMLPSRRRQAENEKTKEELRKRIRDARDDDEKRFQDLARRNEK
jgi:Lysophospholipase